jgi:hypothetical protein
VASALRVFGPLFAEHAASGPCASCTADTLLRSPQAAMVGA